MDITSATITAIVGGERVGTPEMFDTLDPSTGQVFATLSRGGADLVDQAVRAARRALAGWRSTPVLDRSQLMTAFAHRIRTEVDDLASTESRDTGKPCHRPESTSSNAPNTLSSLPREFGSCTAMSSRPMTTLWPTRDGSPTELPG